RPTIVEEEDPLAETPQRRGPELVTACRPLEDVVGEAWAHRVQGQVGEEIGSLALITQRHDVAFWLTGSEGVWHSAQPMLVNSFLPCAIESDVAPVKIVTGVGGARKRWKLAKLTIAGI